MADLCWEEVGYGSSLLAEAAESVVGLTNSTEAADLARTAYPAPNVEYRKANVPELPYPEDHFDVAVAFGVVENLQRPETLVREASRVLKRDGVLVISVPDKQCFSSRTTGGECTFPSFGNCWSASFDRVLMYRQGAVAGGFVFPEAGKIDAAPVESVSLTTPRVGAEPPTTRSVIAVCGNTEVLEQRRTVPGAGSRPTRLRRVPGSRRRCRASARRDKPVARDRSPGFSRLPQHAQNRDHPPQSPYKALRRRDTAPEDPDEEPDTETDWPNSRNGELDDLADLRALPATASQDDRQEEAVPRRH